MRGERSLQALERVVLDLPDPLAREPERDGQIVKRCRLDITKPETLLDDMPMLVGKSFQPLMKTVFEFMAASTGLGALGRRRKHAA